MLHKLFVPLLALVVSLLVVATIYAWQAPDQNPPGGGGALYLSGPNLRTIKHFFVEGKLKIGTSQAPKGIIIYDTNDGSEHCLQVINNALTLTNGDCP